MKKKIIIMMALMSSCMTHVEALDLKEALTATYTNNEDLKADRQLFLKEIEEFPRALANFLPDIGAKITTTNTKQKFDSKFADSRVNLSRSVGPDVVRSLNISQEIFSGGSGVMGLKSAQAGFWIARSKFYKSEQETLLNSVKSYLNICAARENLKISIDSLEFARQNFEMVQEKLKVGEATVTEVSLASANLAKAEAARSLQYANLITENAAFRTLTGIEATEDMTFPLIADGLPETKEQLEAFVNKSNLDLLSAKYTMTKSRSEVKAAAGALLPDARIQLSAQKDFYKEEPRADTSRQNKMSYSTSLIVNIPILAKGGAQHSAIRTKKKESRQAIYALDYKEKEIKANVISTWESFVASKDSIVFVDKAVEAQSLALEGLKQQYSVGASTMLDVLKSQEELNQARTQAVETRKKYILSSYQIRDLMGQMTANQLKLNVKYFSPEQEFRSIKHKVIGF